MGKKISIKFVGMLTIIVVGLLFYFLFSRTFCIGSPVECERTTRESVIVQKGQIEKDYYTHKGINGKTAYAILTEQKAWITTNNSGLITRINFREADPKKHEYWAFYVNGKLAQVGPVDYVTKNEDVIEWKIEKY